MFLPMPGKFEDCGPDSGYALVSTVQRFNVRPTEDPVVFSDPPIRLAPVDKEHVHLWRKANSIAEAWDFAYAQTNREHTLSHTTFVGVLTDDGEHLRSRVCPHGIVHGQSTCIPGKPMITYNYGSFCGCVHTTCSNIDTPVHFVQRKSNNCTTIHVQPKSPYHVYPVQRYLPSYVFTHDRTTSPSKLVRFRSKQLVRKMLLSDVFHDCNARMRGLQGSIPYTDNTVCLAVYTAPCVQLGIIEPTQLVSLNNLDANYTTIHYAKLKCDSLAHMPTIKNIAEHLVAYPRSRFHALAQGVTGHVVADRLSSVDWFCNNDFATLWPTATNVHHGIHTTTGTDVFCKHPDFGQSTWMPRVYETGIVWRGNAYSFLLDRNSWCLGTGLAAPVNVQELLRGVTWYTDPDDVCRKCHTEEFGQFATIEVGRTIPDSYRSFYEKLSQYIFRPLALSVFFNKSIVFRQVKDPVIVRLASDNFKLLQTKFRDGYSMVKICRESKRELVIKSSDIQSSVLPDRKCLEDRWFDNKDIYINVGPDTDVHALLSTVDFIVDEVRQNHKRKWIDALA